MEITTFGDGNATFTVTNNDIRQYNSSGIQFVAGSGVVGTGQFNLNISGNAVANPGTNPLITLLQGIRVDSGVAAGDTFATCVKFGPNSIVGSSDAANKDFRLVASQSTTLRQPGYAGGNTDGRRVRQLCRLADRRRHPGHRGRELAGSVRRLRNHMSLTDLGRTEGDEA